MKYTISILFSFLLFSACKDAPPIQEATTKVESSKSPSNTKGIKHELPAMPVEFYFQLKEKCDAVDYIFHDLPFSINQTDKPSVLSNLSYIGDQQADAVPVGCKALGREFFQANGEIFLEADFYFCPPDYFSYVFIQDKKPIYANRVSDVGVRFYASLISQVSAAPKS